MAVFSVLEAGRHLCYFAPLMNQKPVYLDHNATTPLDPGITTQVPAWLSSWGNPSSIHWAGRGPKAQLRRARRALAEMLDCDPLELVFTSGGSESNNMALKGVFAALSTGWSWSGVMPKSDSNTSTRPRLITSRVEHPSLIKTADALARAGVDVEFLQVDRDGRLDLKQLETALKTPTSLVSIMFANNETGVIHPIKEICEMAHKAGALVHCDGVQALGKVEVSLRQWGVDLASFSGHKFYALKGCGLLYCRRGTRMDSLIHGGGQERGRRAGTENILSISALGEMAGRRHQILKQAERLRGLRDELEARVLKEISGSRILGHEQPRLANTSLLLFDGVDGETLLMNLDVQGFAVSTGAACSSGNPEPSPVLLAMGLSRNEAQTSLRVSLGWENTAEELDRFFEALRASVARLRSFKDVKVTHGV